jgi:hypothetical protein
VLFSFQDVSEPEGYNDCENHNTTTNTAEENFNDENDVDDETMSGKHKTTHIMHTEMLHINNSCAIFVETKSEVLL